MSDREIYFIWNAEKNLKGKFLGLWDMIRGIHSCTLCGIAYDGRTPKSKWDAYKAELKSSHNITAIEYYKNKLPDGFEQLIKDDFPSVIGLDSDKNLSMLLSGQTISQCKGDIEKFIMLLNQAIAQWT